MPINSEITLSVTFRFDEDEIRDAEIEGRHERACRKLFAEEGVEVEGHYVQGHGTVDLVQEAQAAAERKKSRKEAKALKAEETRWKTAPWVEKIRRLTAMEDAGKLDYDEKVYAQRIRTWIEEWQERGEFWGDAGSAYSLYNRCHLGGFSPRYWKSWLAENVMDEKEHMAILYAARDGEPMPPTTWSLEPQFKLVPDTIPGDWEESNDGN